MGRKPSNLTCPICGGVGAGVYDRWVMNSRKKRYAPYYYFKHQVVTEKNGRKIKTIKWCYLTHDEAQAFFRTHPKKQKI